MRIFLWIYLNLRLTLFPQLSGHTHAGQIPLLALGSYLSESYLYGFYSITMRPNRENRDKRHQL